MRKFHKQAIFTVKTNCVNSRRASVIDQIRLTKVYHVSVVSSICIDQSPTDKRIDNINILEKFANFGISQSVSTLQHFLVHCL